MPEQHIPQRLLAVLIDADNVPAAHAGAIMAEIANFGTAALRRVYGDWSSSTVSPWREKIRTLGLNAVQQTANLKGKNATDLGMVIDAMDILHSSRNGTYFDTFVIVSSDSDFTQLAGRIREDGRRVIGIGECRTPASLRNACNRFILLENILSASASNNNSINVVTNSAAGDASADDGTPSKAEEALNILKKCIRPDNNWTLLSSVGDKIHKIHPDFDSRTYGAKSLLELVQSYGDVFDIELRNPHHNIRLKDEFGGDSTSIRASKSTEFRKAGRRRRRRRKSGININRSELSQQEGPT